jgi:hypothetical protein
VAERETGRIAEADEVAALLDSFFAVQAEWQTMIAGAAEALASFGDAAEIVMLTAMPHRHRATRRAHLDALGLPYPLLTTEMAKGPAIASLRGPQGRPVAFVDDLPPNLVSARKAVADAHLFHLMSDNALRSLLPTPPSDVVVVDDWPDAAPRIASVLGI